MVYAKFSTPVCKGVKSATESVGEGRMFGPSVFIARQHIAADARYWYSNSVRPSVRPSIRLSVRDTLVLYENGLTYRHSFSTIR